MPRRRAEGSRAPGGLVFACARAVAALAVLVMATVGSGYGAPATACCPPSAGVLKVATAGVAPLVWYDATHPPPPLTNQIAEIAANLYPGRTGAMRAYVRNTGTAAGTPGIAIADLVDTQTLASSIEATITYTSSLKPGTTYTVATGTVRSLASAGVLRAPIKLAVYSKCCAETGTWTIRVGMPDSASNAVQGRRCTCSVRFTLTGDCR